MSLCQTCREKEYCNELCLEAQAESARDDSDNYSKTKYKANPQPLTSYAENMARKRNHPWGIKSK